MDGGNGVRTEVGLAARSRNFDQWDMHDFDVANSDWFDIPCAKIGDYPNLRVTGVTVVSTFELVSYAFLISYSILLCFSRIFNEYFLGFGGRLLLP